MKRIMVAAYDTPFLEYGRRMYRSFARFNPRVPRHFVHFRRNGRDALTPDQIGELADMGVVILDGGDYPDHPRFWDMLLWPAVKGLAWDSLMWVDADTMILRPLTDCWRGGFDFVGHPDRENYGLRTHCSISKNNWILDGIDCARFSTGLWVVSSRKLLKAFYDFVTKTPTGGDRDSDGVTIVVNQGPYTYRQLCGYRWNFSRALITRAEYRGGKIYYREDGREWQPYTAGFSRVPVIPGVRDERMSSPAIDQFYKEQVER